MIRPLQRDDVAPLAGVLARAFDDDPPFLWSQPNPRKRARRLRRMYGGRVRTLWAEDQSVTTDDRAGVALWAPPDGWRVPPSEMVSALPAVLGPRLVPMLAGMRKVEELHPRAPHLYLAVLGVDPSRQGSGLGTALLEPGLARCDREAIPAFLETAKERNVAYYERFGFRVTDCVKLPRGGPPIWLMWRDPR